MNRFRETKKKPAPSQTPANAAHSQAQPLPDAQSYNEQIQQAIQTPNLQTLKPNVIQMMQQTHGNRFVASLVQRSKSPAITPTTHGQIQRMNTDEAYYSNILRGGGKIKEQLAAQSITKSFIGSIRQYTLLTNNKTTSNVNTLESRIQILQGQAIQLASIFQQVVDGVRAELGQISQREQTVLQRTTAEINTMITTALDDIAQDIIALRSLKANPQLQAQGLTWRQALFLERGGIGLDQLATESQLAAGTGGNAAGNPQRLGGGQVSEVTALSYQNGNGGTDRRVFKPNEVAPAVVAGDLDKGNVQTTYRIIAATRVEALIKQKMQQANQAYESLLGKTSVALYGGKIGSATDFAPGQEAMKAKVKDTGFIESQSYLNVDFNDISLQRQVANLQLLDIITGQIDRHMGNVLVNQGNGPTKVTGIDNDFAFSKTSTTTDTYNQSGAKTIMPTIIDRYFAQAILQIDDASFVSAIKGLSQLEIRSSLSRFQEVKQQLQAKLQARQLIALAGDAQPGERTWNQITMGDYAQSSRWNPGDYMAQLVESRAKALTAMQANPQIHPTPKDGKWVIEYDQGLFLMAQADDGSDLWELYRQANPGRAMMGRGRQRGRAPQVGALNQ